MSNVNRIDHYKVGRIESLGMHNDSEAKAILEKVAYQVQPIMRRRSFTVPVLREFFPSRSNLLGMNVGGGGGNTMEILLRLRPASSPTTFLRYDTILGTMLHELSHNHHGNHAGPFYKLLDELKAECEELMAKGIGGTGAGFDAPSAGKVGGRFLGHGDQLSSFDRRQAALTAAEQRAKRQAIMPSGPRKLGQDSTGLRDLPPALAAAAAAERRALDNQWCPTEQLSQDIDEGTSIHAALQAILDGRFNNGPSTSAAADAAVEKKNNVSSSNGQRKQQPSPPPPPPPPPAPSPPPATTTNNDVIDLTNDSSQPEYEESNTTNPKTEWECPACTYINTKPLALQCDVCSTIRPSTRTTTLATPSSPPIQLE